MITTLSATGTTATAATGTRSQIGKDQFLQLLVTQLRHQDPLSPLEPHEFAAQLAQFTSVEQLTQLNDELALQTDTIALSALLNKTSFSAALLGRQVVAEGNQVTVTGSGAATVRIDVGGAGGLGKLVVKDSGGRQVATRELGTLAAGRREVALPAGLAAGSYTYEVTVTDAKGSAVSVTTYTTGVVDGVFFKNGSITLRLGGLEIPLESVAEIETAPTNAAP